MFFDADCSNHLSLCHECQLSLFYYWSLPHIDMKQPLGHIFKEYPKMQGITIYSTINMYKFIKIRHDIIKYCHGNYQGVKKFNYKLEIEIFRNSTQHFLCVLRGSF